MCEWKCKWKHKVNISAHPSLKFTILLLPVRWWGKLIQRPDLVVQGKLAMGGAYMGDIIDKVVDGVD